MTEVFGTHSSNFASKMPTAARRSVAVFAALLGLATLTPSISGANAAQATQVREVDDPGRIPYQSSQTISAGQRAFVFSAVPVGHRLVIQHVSAHVNLQSAVTDQAEISVSASDSGSSNFLSQFSGKLVEFDQPVQLYVDAGDVPEVVVLVDAGLTVVANAFGTMSGYLLDCTVAPMREDCQVNSWHGFTCDLVSGKEQQSTGLA